MSKSFSKVKKCRIFYYLLIRTKVTTVISRKVKNENLTLRNSVVFFVILSTYRVYWNCKRIKKVSRPLFLFYLIREDQMKGIEVFKYIKTKN